VGRDTEGVETAREGAILAHRRGKHTVYTVDYITDSGDKGQSYLIANTLL